jgi:hypothetical protein
MYWNVCQGVGRLGQYLEFFGSSSSPSDNLFISGSSDKSSFHLFVDPTISTLVCWVLVPFVGPPERLSPSLSTCLLIYVTVISKLISQNVNTKYVNFKSRKMLISNRLFGLMSLFQKISLLWTSRGWHSLDWRHFPQEEKNYALILL